MWYYWGLPPGDEPPPEYIPPAPPPDITTYPFGAQLPNDLCLELGDCVPCWSPGASADPTPLCYDPLAPEPGTGGGGMGLAIALLGGALLLGAVSKLK